MAACVYIFCWFVSFLLVVFKSEDFLINLFYFQLLFLLRFIMKAICDFFLKESFSPFFCVCCFDSVVFVVIDAKVWLWGPWVCGHGPLHWLSWLFLADLTVVFMLCGTDGHKAPLLLSDSELRGFLSFLWNFWVYIYQHISNCVRSSNTFTDTFITFVSSLIPPPRCRVLIAG